MVLLLLKPCIVPLLQQVMIISENQKHSSTVAKMFYRKKQSRSVAIEGKRCMEKMVGDLCKDTTSDIMNVFDSINNDLTMQFFPMLCMKLDDYKHQKLT